ncbi:MAG TPA: Gfo/Idh/MocA family oxidoreductase [Pirellulales bacterium]|nr:Gfo/Idh/MocA family oxidoreductase [Pirellulales bacterium]
MALVQLPLRIGLIGCGAVGRLHAERLSADGRAAIRVCCDPSAPAAEALRRRYAPEAAVETDVVEALDRHALDAVVISSPTLLHYEQTCLAFDRGLDVLCEKPLAASREQIVDLIARHQRMQRILCVAYQRRYKSAYQTARRELTERAERYGPLQQVHIFVCERWEQTIHGTWRDDPRVGAGYFGDAGSHQIDVVNHITGQRPVAIYATSDRRASHVEIVTTALARLEGGAGLTAHFVGDANHWREDIHFHCRDADLILRSTAVTHADVFRGGENRLEPLTDLEAESSPDRALIDAIVDGTPTLSPAEVALPMFDWMAGVLRSIEQNRWIELPLEGGYGDVGTVSSSRL